VNQPFVIETLEPRALMAATIVRESVPFAFSGPTQALLKAEVIDGSFSGTDKITTLTNDQRTHSLIKETTTGSGTGIDTGTQYTLAQRAMIVDNFSAADGSGVSHFMIHSQLTSESGETIREVYLVHFMITHDGQVRSFEKVI